MYAMLLLVLFQFAGSLSTDKMSSQQRQHMAKKRLNQIIASNYKELQSYSCILAFVFAEIKQKKIAVAV